MQYRRDIDGLRAVAIVPVVLYHVGIPGFSGGFVGVDVFFVISGFLITGLLQEDLRQGRLSLVRFYERRIRRIIPALFAMIATVCVAGYAVLLPSDLMATAISCLAAMFFVANLYFKSKAGYFDTTAITKPLWHTWSLSVEEQFYIFFPLMLMGVWRFRPQWTVRLLVAIGTVSFVAASYETFAHSKAAFYVMPLRIWELLAGSLVALRAPRTGRPDALRTWADGVALLLILVPAVTYDAGLPFPGLAAAPPVIGTALLLRQRQGQATLVQRFLQTGPMRYFGLVSYSLYLWHWPVIVFATYYIYPVAPSLAFRAALIAVAIAIATASWRLIEQPFRRPKAATRIFVPFATTAVLATVLAIANLAPILTRGTPRRFPVVARWDAFGADHNPRSPGCLARVDRPIPVDRRCTYGDTAVPPRIAIWGDSSSVELALAIGDALGKQHQSMLEFSFAGCAAAMGLTRVGGCVERNDQALALIVGDKKIEDIILTALYAVYGYEGASGQTPDASAFEAGLRDTVTRLVAAGKRVWIVYPVPTPDVDTPRVAALYALRGLHPQDFRTSRAAFERDNHRAAAFLDTLLGDRVKKLDLTPALCDKTSCAIAAGDNLLYFDAIHLSVAGARHVVRMFDPVIAPATSASAHKAMR